MRVLCACVAFGLSAVVLILQSEGVGGFRPFIGLEALSIVLIGTVAQLLAAHPLRAILALEDAAMLAYAARCALRAGAIGMLIGVVLLLSSTTDVVEFPRRLGMAVVPMLFGLVLSAFVFAPLAERAGRRR